MYSTDVKIFWYTADDFSTPIVSFGIYMYTCIYNEFTKF